MGYHALGSSGIWDRMVHVYYVVFDESTDIRMYIYVVVLNQNTPTSGLKEFILGPRLEEGGTTSLHFSSRGEQKFFKAD